MQNEDNTSRAELLKRLTRDIALYAEAVKADEKAKAGHEDDEHWQRVCADGRNQKLAARIAHIGESARPEHKEILTRALQQWADVVNLSKRFPAVTDLLTGNAAYHLAYCESRFSAKHERRIVLAVARAIEAGKTAKQTARLFKSKTNYHKRLADFTTKRGFNEAESAEPKFSIVNGKLEITM